MKHPLVHTARSLTGMALVLLGLSTYGCGDSGTVTEPAVLGNLSASDGTLEPPFTPETTNYAVKLFGDESSTTITVSPRVAGDAIRINNQETTSQTVTLASIGASEVLNIVVTETGTGGTSRSYTVRISREEEDTTLGALSSSTGTLAPSPFDKTELAQSINDVGNGVLSIILSATKSDPNAVMVIDLPINPVTVPAGTASGQATVQLGQPGSPTTVPIIITGPKGGKSTYQITINRGASDNAFLGSLSISPGKLTFKTGTTLYDVSVGSRIDKVTVTAKPQDDTASMTILVNGAVINTQPITLLGPDSTTRIKVRVTSQKGTSKDYDINVKRAALNGNNFLKSLTVLPGSLKPAFDPDDRAYNVSQLSNVTSVKITAAPEEGTARVTINGQSSPYSVELGAPGPRTQVTIPIVVTAQNNVTKTYNVTLDRAALGGNFNLQSLTVTGHTLSRQSETRYTLEVDNSVDRITVNATPQDSGARVRLLVSNVQKTNPISLPLGPSTTEIEIEVTAQNGSPKSYFIAVTRKAPSSNNNLSALSVTAGSTVTPFSPPFDSNTVTVAPGIEEVVVRATKEDVNATMGLGSVTVGPGTRSGRATFQLNGAGGDPTPISFTVTAQNGVNVTTYAISVIRPAAATKPDRPRVAPDLIPEDDYCFPQLPPNEDQCFIPTVPGVTNSREDNLTNVKRPRFTIPSPTAGTPSLYVDTTKYPFPAGATTLQPSVDLSQGNHRITYTLTNAGGESDPSPPLTVTIDTQGPVQ